MEEKQWILVVEDDPPFAELLQLHLVAAGYGARVVTDGLAALWAFEEERPALVTLDLALPAISGFRLVRLFKRRRPEIPVLVVTALAFEEAEDTAYAGADDFLTKPFDPDQLVQKVQFHLRPSRRRPAPAVAASYPPRPSRELVGV
jgi:DNA-binding response OmpR family regulator